MLKACVVTLRAPVITTRQSTQHDRQNKNVYRVDNYQYYTLHKFDPSLGIQTAGCLNLE